MRVLYTALFRLLTPLVVVHQLWRSWHEPGYRGRVHERWGYGAVVRSPCLWVHAVSVGEVQAAVPLVRALLQDWPTWQVLVTTTTSTGAARVNELFGAAVEHRYLPLDLPGAARRFLKRAQPRLCVVMETELWPNLLSGCAARSIPVLIASARLSVRSMRAYRRLRGVFREVLGGGAVRVLAQTTADAARYLELGVPASQVSLMGNLKFDLAVPADVRAGGRACRDLWGHSRPVWVAGSTHEGEEQVLLAAHQRLLRHQPEALLVLVPRHPARFAAAAAHVERSGLSSVRRSRGGTVLPTTAVLLADTLGELLTLYAAADVAFVGGSLVPVGGHNLLEPAALGLPVLSGRAVFNAPEIAAALAAAGALTLVDTADELAGALAGLFTQTERRVAQGVQAAAVVAANRGALTRLLEAMRPVLTSD